MTAPNESSALAVPDALTDEEFRERLTTLAIASNADDAKAKDLLAFCRAHPKAWEKIQNLEQDAIDSWLTLLAPGTAGDTHKAAWKREHIEQQLKRRRKALHAEGDSQMETLLINRILSAWLMTMHADETYARWLSRGGGIKEGEYHQKRLDRAQRQFLRAMQTLATVRKLIGRVAPAARDDDGSCKPSGGTYLAARLRSR